jgi:hypothetical protein
MWCGGCYASDLMLIFNVNHLKNVGEERLKKLNDRARLAKAWRNKRQAPDTFLKARYGDHMLVPFECDLCIFHKMHGHSPYEANPIDGLLLACIWIKRIHLDAFWRSASATVYGNC